LTFCPVNSLPDLIYVSVDFDDVGLERTFVELYAVRKKIRKLVSGKKMFMEDVADLLYKELVGCTSVTVTLMFGRHVVIVGED
jgi:hypothetical protein